MPGQVWTLADLTPEQQRLVAEAEKDLGDGILLAFARGTVAPSDLTPDQLARLQALEKQLGLVLVAVRSS